MITHKKDIIEYHKNRKIQYTCTMAFLSKETEHLYDARICGEKGSFIRVDFARRYWDNGQLNWSLEYDEKGKVISSQHFYQDGTVMKL